MMVFKRKQVVVLSLVLMIVVAGYLQYSYKKSSISVEEKDNGRLGEAVYVDSEYSSSADEELSTSKSDSKDKEESKDNNESKNSKSTKTVSASKEANDFFARAKLDKESSIGKDTESLKAITEDTNATKEAKTKAFDQMTKMVANAEKEMRVETLIKEKGFTDVLALFGDDGSVDIVIKAPNLTSAETAQISDIVSRHADVSLEKVHVKNIF